MVVRSFKLFVGLFIFSGALVVAEASWQAPRAQKALILDLEIVNTKIFAVGTRGHLLVSDDLASNWKQILIEGSVLLTDLEASSDTIMITGHESSIYRSKDGGVSFKRIFHQPDWDKPLFKLQFMGGENWMAVGAYGLLLNSTDGGETWTESSISEDEPHLYDIYLDQKNKIIWVVGEFGGIFFKNIADKTWQQVPSFYSGSFFTIERFNEGMAVAGLRGNMFRRNELSGKWTQMPTKTQASIFKLLHLPLQGLSCLTLSNGQYSCGPGLDDIFLNKAHIGQDAAIMDMLPLDRSSFLIAGENGLQIEKRKQ